MPNGGGVLFRILLFAFALSLSCSAVAVAAQPICISAADSTVLQLKHPALTAKLQKDRDDAAAAAISKSIVYSSGTGFDWATQALIQCNVALGYLAGGHVDAQSSTKCDCFHANIPVLK